MFSNLLVTFIFHSVERGNIRCLQEVNECWNSVNDLLVYKTSCHCGFIPSWETFLSLQDEMVKVEDGERRSGLIIERNLTESIFKI